jgi:hypothetical protein
MDLRGDEATGERGHDELGGIMIDGCNLRCLLSWWDLSYFER